VYLLLGAGLAAFGQPFSNAFDAPQAALAKTRSRASKQSGTRTASQAVDCFLSVLRPDLLDGVGLELALFILWAVVGMPGSGGIHELGLYVNEKLPRLRSRRTQSNVFHSHNDLAEH
jgi:hypothetical protein